MTDTLSALKRLVEAVEFTPLGVRALTALTEARAAIAAAATWDDKDALVADGESWGLFERSDGKYGIERCDDHDKQWTDDEAYLFVSEKADAGSETHKKAIALHGTAWPK